MAKAIQMFQCEFCDHKLKTESGMKRHEEKCTANPANIEQAKKFDQMHVLSENIRNTATSPEHLIQLIEAACLEFGVKITFTNYPARFNLSICNSHNAPKGYQTNWGQKHTSEGIPTGYPGWTGHWEGTMSIVDKKLWKYKSLSFSHIRGDNFDREGFKFWFIQTGSGSSGDAYFQYSGMLWMYDFPLMHEEFKQSGGEFDVMAKDYSKLLETYKKEYTNSRKHYVSSRSDLITVRQLQSEMGQLLGNLDKIERGKEKFYINEFNKKYGVPVPLPNTAFSNIGDVISKIHGDVSFSGTVRNPKLEDLLKTMDNLKERINKYITTHAEEFI